MSVPIKKCAVCAKVLSTAVYCFKCYTPYCNQHCKNKDSQKHPLVCNNKAKTYPWQRAAQTAKGTGYGGGIGDTKEREEGRKQAAKRETKRWEEWKKELSDFCATHRTGRKRRRATVSSNREEEEVAVLNTLKQVLRCQTPDWYWKQPQRGLYEVAIEVSEILAEEFPKSWGDPDDKESPIAALEELNQSSQLLYKQLSRSNTPNQPSASLGEHDDSLLAKVTDISRRARAAVKRVLELPDCSMMDASGFYRQALRPLAFDMVESFCQPPHYFASARGSQTNQLKLPGRKKKSNKKPPASKTNDAPTPSGCSLWKELSTYPTSLPIEYGSSIFVRAQEGQIHSLRVLIIGPDDTPYANGAFLFDVSLSQDYPHCAPRVHFLTTSNFLTPNGGNVRFNPNLYADGKVCLSLLGTWSGPGWQPGESTLLQVLISIQSAILGTSDPYFNEPGFESSQDSQYGQKSSDDYNRKIRRQTLEIAILPFLQNEINQCSQDQGKQGNKAHYFSEFEGVLSQHFRLKQRVMDKQILHWYRADPSFESLYHDYSRLQQLLKAGKKSSARSQKRKLGAVDTGQTSNEVIEIDDNDNDMKDDAADRIFDADTEVAAFMSLGKSRGKQGGAVDVRMAQRAGDDRKPRAKQISSKGKNQEEIFSIDDDEIVQIDSPDLTPASQDDRARQVVLGQHKNATSIDIVDLT